MPYPQTPELDKMKAVHDRSQVVGEFLEWLKHTKNCTIAVAHKHTEHCYDGPGRAPNCGLFKGQYDPLYTGTEALLAEFFEIDLEKVEEERRAILEHLQQQQEREVP